MAVMVDLEKAKEIICKARVFSKKNICSDLEALAYGKIYTCWSCGENINAGEHGWYHVNGGAQECERVSGAWKNV